MLGGVGVDLPLSHLVNGFLFAISLFILCLSFENLSSKRVTEGKKNPLSMITFRKTGDKCEIRKWFLHYDYLENLNFRFYSFIFLKLIFTQIVELKALEKLTLLKTSTNESVLLPSPNKHPR